MAYATPSVSILYQLARLRRAVLTWLTVSTNIVLFLAFVLVAGVGSSLYVVANGWLLTNVREGPWTMWSRAAHRDQDPYTRAHFARTGDLPMPVAIAATWEARFDADGKRLHSSCEYLLEGDAVEASWFSIAVYDDDGLMIPNSAERYAFTSQTLARNPDDSYFVVLSRDARPGNWLPVGGAGRLAIVMTMIEPKPSVAASADQLPTIRRVGCR
jgi:hypothetical protein